MNDQDPLRQALAWQTAAERDEALLVTRIWRGANEDPERPDPPARARDQVGVTRRRRWVFVVLSALAAADGLAIIPEEHDALPAGSEVEVIRIR